MTPEQAFDEAVFSRDLPDPFGPELAALRQQPRGDMLAHEEARLVDLEAFSRARLALRGEYRNALAAADWPTVARVAKQLLEVGKKVAAILLLAVGLHAQTLPADIKDTTTSEVVEFLHSEIRKNKDSGASLAGDNVWTGTNEFQKAVTLASGTAVTAVAPSTPTANTFYRESFVRAWANFTGTGTVALQGGLNISSVTDLGTGSYRVNWARPFANVNYAVSCFCQLNNSPVICMAYSAVGNAPRTTSVDIACVSDNEAFTAADADRVTVMAIGVQ